MKTVDIEDINLKASRILAHEFEKPKREDVIKYKPIIDAIIESRRVLDHKDLIPILRLHKFNGKRSFLFLVYLELKKDNLVDCTFEHIVRKTLQIKPCKSWSGIVTITIFTAAYPSFTNKEGVRVTQEFSCAYDCSYCPKEPDMPRSYLKMEPAVLRATRNHFDCVSQIWDRMQGLYVTGHNVDKLEIIVSGGTWTSYPIEYREEFCRDIYYAANTFRDADPKREKYDIGEEKKMNQKALCRIVGLTIETRPDTITKLELKSLRDFGVTRVQLGIQHIEDEILKKINRRCSSERTIKAIEMLKRNCFKIDSHWMLNLPYASAEKDDHMLNRVLLGLKTHVKREDKYVDWIDWIKGKTEQWEYYNLVCPELQTDTWKIYPCAVVPWSDIEQWYREGTYIPYKEEEMIELLLDTLSLVYPWIRLARIIRDIPESYMYNEGTGADNTNMRQELESILKRDGIYCMDIRNREVKNRDWNGEYTLVIRHYNASHGDEYFISAESDDNKILYGFVRLRLDDAKDKAFTELDGCALIREVHVYGDLTAVGQYGKHVQHRGIGRKLMARAEALAREKGYKKLAVIAAEGNKEYYRDKLGFDEGDFFLIKYIG